MSIQAIRGMRVSSSMQSQMLLEQMRTNMLQLFGSQQQLSTGKRLLVPSDDPAGAARALNLNSILERQGQLQRNADVADRFAAATESALVDVRDVLNQASAIASQNAGVPADAQQRAASAGVVKGLIEQLLTVANRQQNGIYLFAGQTCDKPPFEEALGGVLYKGDTSNLSVNVDGTGLQMISLTGEQVFGAISAEVRGWNPLTPRLDQTVRLADLRGAGGEGVRLGPIDIQEVGGVGSFRVDLSRANTLGDVVNAINAAAGNAGASVNASVTTGGLQLAVNPAFTLQVTDPGQGTAALDLGIRQAVPAAGPLVSPYLKPKVTLTTPVAYLQSGSGVDQSSGLLISNAGKTVQVDLSGAQTVQDILNAINGTGLGVMAQINEDGTGIDVRSRLSGSQLSIGEAGGLTATWLGIRSLHEGTTLASLNEGRGVGTAAGADFRIVAKSGANVDVDLDGARTMADVIVKINAAASGAGVSLTASLATTGNGLRLSDGTGGAGALHVERLSGSAAMDGLGLEVAATGSELISRHVSIVRPSGTFTVLEDLWSALSSNDTAGITAAGEKLSGLLQGIGTAQGQAGTLGQQVAAQKAHLGDAVLASKSLLSEVQDADYTEAITRFTQAQTILQANMMTGSRLMQLSLLDFLR